MMAWSFRGKSNHPCFLRINGSKVEIRDANLIWGRDSFETEGLLKAPKGRSWGFPPSVPQEKGCPGLHASTVTCIARPEEEVWGL